MADLTRIAWRFDGSNGDNEQNFYCGYGLAGPDHGQCPPADDPFGMESAHRPCRRAIWPSSGLWVDRERGIGIAYFATGLGDDPPRGRSSYREIEEWLRRSWGAKAGS